jgi:hypothetical protein
MTQALYAHMNNKRKKKRRGKKSLIALKSGSAHIALAVQYKPLASI